MRNQSLVDYTNQYFGNYRKDSVNKIWEKLRMGDSFSARAEFEELFQAMKSCKDEDTRAFCAQSLMKDTNTVLVSSIRTYGNLGPFRPLDINEFKGIRLFDILLRVGQIVCASTVSVGDNNENLYGNWGVIVGSGNIQNAYPYDAVTSVNKGKTFSKFQSRIKNVRPSEQVAHALQARSQYNEINIELHAIAGLYFCQNSKQAYDSDYPSESFMDLVTPLKIPQYVLKDGLFYPVDNFRESKNINLTSPSGVEDILAETITIDEDQSFRMIEYLLEKLTLAPRNVVTSGMKRGIFFYEHSKSLILREHELESFLEHHKELLLNHADDSVNLYAAITLHSFAEAASNDDEQTLSNLALGIAQQFMQIVEYQEYKQRILPKGNLSITRDDLEYYLKNETLPLHLANH